MKPRKPGAARRRDSKVAPGRDAFGRTKAEADRLAARVLSEAFALLVRHGWSPTLTVAEAHRQARPRGTLSLLEAINYVEAHPLDSFNAKHALNRLEWPAFQWEEHPLRTFPEVLELFRKAIGRLGAEVPSMPVIRGQPRRGGWRISSGVA